MTLRVVLSVVEIVAFAAIVGFFLVVLDRRLRPVVGNLGKIAAGVEAVGSHCTVIGPGADEINALLAGTAHELEDALREADALA